MAVVLSKIDHQAQLTRKFQTCRYWALGPGCPDTIDGVDYCQYAHRETGRLASPLEQRGTCINFSRDGTCIKGAACWYEHRNTGVTGMYQGTVELTGFELEIADAAYKGGFETTNHPGLFDLIWAVKRVALRRFQGGRQRPPPPRHPVYPDRFRPSGLGDNTKRKRKRATSNPVPFHQLRRVTPPKFNPVPSLMQKGGTQEDPIALDSETDTVQQELADPSIKRQKKTQSSTNDRKLSLNKFVRKYTPYNLENSNRPATRTGSNNLPLGQLSRLLNPAAPSFSPMPTSTVSQSNLGSTLRAETMRIDPSLSAEDNIVNVLVQKKDELLNIRTCSNRLQDEMKALFESYRVQLDSDAMIIFLRGLSDNMSKIWEGAKAGMEDIDNAMDCLRSEKGGEVSLLDI